MTNQEEQKEGFQKQESKEKRQITARDNVRQMETILDSISQTDGEKKDERLVNSRHCKRPSALGHVPAQPEQALQELK